MLSFLREHRIFSEHDARLFGAACCRRCWDLLSNEARRVVEVVERQGDDLASTEELEAVRAAFNAVNFEWAEPDYAAYSANAAVAYLLGNPRTDPEGYAIDLVPWAMQAGQDQMYELEVQAGFIHCLLGPPPSFRPKPMRPEWLAFEDGVVPKLAHAIRDERGFDRMPILADMLEDAGCGDEVLLEHLRRQEPHCHGCYALKLLTGEKWP
jgi:hypothetical protein